MINRDNFIERSILGALSFLKESLFADEFALKKGFLQALHPRIKLITFLALLLFAAFSKSIPALLSLYFSCLLLAGFSKINIFFFLKRTWIFIPIFSLFIAIPALFSSFSPGEPLLHLKVWILDLTITKQGVGSAALFVLRVITSLSLVVLISLTTPHTYLMKSLRILGVPQIFVMLLGMCYRYIYLFVEIIENTYLAIKSRIGGRLYYKRGQGIVAFKIAALWQRSSQLNEEVYNAMLSRGYAGEPVVLKEPGIKIRDLIWLSFVLMILVTGLYINYTGKA